MEHPQIPDDITRVTEAELRADLTTFLDCVAFAEDEETWDPSDWTCFEFLASQGEYDIFQTCTP